MTVQDPVRPQPADDLVIKARSEREAFGQLFDHFYPLIFAYCLRRLIGRAAAEDAVSEVFVKVARNMHSFPGNTTQDFRRWLYRIATNEINAHLRQSIRRRELLEAAARMGRIPADVAAPIVESEPVEWSSLYQALETLSDRERSVVSLRFFGNLKHQEIAEVLEIKTGTIRVMLSRSLDKLRAHLRAGESDDGGTKK